MVHQPSIATVSLGRCTAGHSLQNKLEAAASQDFRGIELFYEDLVNLAASFPGGATPENQLDAASTIRRLCSKRGLAVICLQPFVQYEGLLDRDAHNQRVEDMRFWIRLAHALGTDLILLPSSYLPPAQVTADQDVIVRDMQEIADLGSAARPVVRFAFEALCWGTRIDTWEASWNVVQGVDRANFGICLDSFNFAARIFADPLSATGMTDGACEAVRASIARLVADVDTSRIFLLQVADAERLQRPLTSEHDFFDPDQPARMSWSRNARLFYGEDTQGAYLPVRAILSAIVDELGYHGWISFEVFSRALFDTAPTVPATMAQRAMQSWRRMVVDLDLQEQKLDKMQPML